MDQIAGDGPGSGAVVFHRNEAISAVQDEDQFYGDEEDYEDLYNHVNVGERFHHSVQRTDDPPPPPRHHPPPAAVSDTPAEKPLEPAPVPVRPNPPVQVRPVHNEGFNRPIGQPNANGGGGGGGTCTLFVGDLHWWTTDADLEVELAKYGAVREVKFFDEKASGKSKGYCQVDFLYPTSASACKERMHGHQFHGKPCVVAFSSPYGVRRMGEAHVSTNQQNVPQNQNQNQNQNMGQKGRGGGVGNGGGGPQMGGNYGWRGGGNWVRGGGGGGGMGNRGPMGNMRTRMGPMGGRGIMGNGGMVALPPPVLHPGAMIGQGFDFGVAAAMAMGHGYGGFPAGPVAGAFPGMLPSFPQVWLLT